MPCSTTGTTVSLRGRCPLPRSPTPRSPPPHPSYFGLTPDSFTENFGPTGLIDDVLGTNKQFKVWLSELKRRDVAAGVGKWGRKAARAELAEATPEA